MTDRELLEAAAKAIGIELDFSIRGDFPPYYVNERGGHSSWNPLTDDGDAFRLAMKLNMRVSGGQVDWVGNEWGVNSFFDYKEDDYDDLLRATRRAIVGAAAGTAKS